MVCETSIGTCQHIINYLLLAFIYFIFAYSLIKMLYWMSDKSSTMLTKAQLLHAIKRNFDGYNNDEVDPVKIFGDFLNPDFDVSNFLTT